MEISNNVVSETKELLSSLKYDLVKKSQLVRIDEVSALTTLAKSSINLWVTQSKFPKPIALSATVKVWKLQDVSDWIEHQKLHQ
jgi:prophage regulatory protein